MHSPVPEIGKISDFVKLVTTASALIAPPAAILGLAFFCLECLSKRVQDGL